MKKAINTAEFRLHYRKSSGPEPLVYIDLRTVGMNIKSLKIRGSLTAKEERQILAEFEQIYFSLGEPGLKKLLARKYKHKEYNRYKNVGEPKKKTIITLGQAVEMYMTHCEKVNKTRSILIKKSMFNNMKEFFDFECDINSINKYMIERFIEWRLFGEIKPSTINLNINTLRAFYSWLIKKELTLNNPLLNIEPLIENELRDRTVSEEEFKLLIDNSITDFIKLAIQLSYYTGMRKNEIESLMLPDKNETLYQSWAAQNKINWVNLKGRQIVLNETKGHRKKIRRRKKALIIYLNEFLCNLIQDYIEKTKPDDKLIPTNNLYYAWSKTVKESGISDIKFHDLRRTCISRLARAGFSRWLIQKMVGQVSQRVYDRYAKANEETMLRLTNFSTSDTNQIQEAEILPFKSIMTLI